MSVGIILLIKLQPSFIFPLFFYQSFSGHPGYHMAVWLHFLVSSDLWLFLGFALSFMTLMPLKSTGQVFCRTSLSVGLPEVFLWIGWNCRFWSNHRGDVLLSHHLGGICYQSDLLVKVMCARFLHPKLLLPIYF